MMDIEIFPSGPFLDFGQRTPDKVSDTDFFGYISQQAALFLFFDVAEFLDFVRKVVGEGEEAVGTLEGS